MFSRGLCIETISALSLRKTIPVVTDHAPLQWLCAQKMEGLLARWALAIQEYEFTITYCRGKENGNADALSRKVHLQMPTLTVDIYQQQCSDPVIQQLRVALHQDKTNLHVVQCGVNHPFHGTNNSGPNFVFKMR